MSNEAGAGIILQNDVATGRQIDTPLAHARSPTVHGAPMTLDLESTRRALIAMRVKHGAKSAIGYRCSSLIEMLQNLQEAKDEDQRRFLTRCIKDMMTDLAALNAEEL